MSSSGGSRWKPTAPCSPWRGQASGRRTARAAGRRPERAARRRRTRASTTSVGGPALGAARSPPARARSRSPRPPARRPRSSSGRAVAPAGLERLGVLGPVGRPRGTRSSRGRSCGPAGPAATIRAWIGLGRQRGSPNDSSVNDFATSKPTSMPTRSISSNGPIRKPPPSRQMRSICSCVATRSWSRRSASRAERAPAAVDEEAGAVGGEDHGLAHRLARRAGQLHRPVARLVGADHLEQLHQRRRVEEVHAHDVLGPRRGAGERGDGDRRGVGGEHRVVAADLRQSARTARASGRRARAPPRSRARSAASPSSASTGSSRAPASAPHASLLDPAVQAAAHAVRRRAPAPRAPGRGAARASRPRSRAGAIPAPMVPAPTTPSVTASALTGRGTRACASRGTRCMPSTRSSVAIASSNSRRSWSRPGAAARSRRPRARPAWPSRAASGGRLGHHAGQLERVASSHSVSRRTPGSRCPSRWASSARDAPPGEHQLHRPLLAHHAREPLRAAAAGDDPEQDLGLAELRRSRTPRSCRTPAPARSRRPSA